MHRPRADRRLREAVLARDGTTILSYGGGGGYGPLRELLAERHGVEPGRVFVTTGGLQGFVFYIAAQLQRRPGPRPRGGADIRPPSQAARLAGGRGREPADGRRGPRPRRARDGARPRRRCLVSLHDSDVPESERSHAGRPTAPAARRDRRRARPRRPRGRSVRPGALRGRAAALPARAGGWAAG